MEIFKDVVVTLWLSAITMLYIMVVLAPFVWKRIKSFKEVLIRAGLLVIGCAGYVGLIMRI